MGTKQLQDLLDATTPGPWRVDSDPAHFDSMSCIYSNGACIAHTCAHFPQLEADARLIAIAPDLARWVIAAEKLVEALRNIAAFDDDIANKQLEITGRYGCFDEPHSVQTARAALAEWEASK